MTQEEPRALRGSRRVSGAGGALLALSFFLPALRACKSDVVPASELAKLADPTISPLQAASELSVFGAPYLFGFLVVVGALAAAGRARRASGVVIAALLAGVVITAAAGFASTLREWNEAPLAAALAVLLGASAVYGVRAARRADGGLLSLRWMSALLATAWFSFWLVGSQRDARIGLVTSLLGSLAVLGAATSEVRARTGLSLGRALGRLAIAAVELPRATGDRG